MEVPGPISGGWDDNISWEFIFGDTLPDISLCAAVYCLALLPGQENKVVLTRNERGWEMLGGHIEPGETPERAMLRECLEEGGFTPEWHQLFGYRKVMPKRPVPHRDRDGYYPFPVGYIAHFLASSTLPLQPPTGEEILESRIFSRAELSKLEYEQLPIIHAGIDIYARKHAAK